MAKRRWLSIFAMFMVVALTAGWSALAAPQATLMSSVAQGELRPLISE